MAERAAATDSSRGSGEPGDVSYCSGEREHGSEPDVDLDIHTLVRDYHQAVYRYAFRLTGHAGDAEDLTQQTFLIAHQRLHQLREPEHVRAWLFAVLRRTLGKARRRQRPLAAVDADVQPESVPVPPEEPVDTEALQDALNQLSDEQRLVVLMFYQDQLSYEEIASELEIPMGTVMSRLARAKARLRDLLTPPT